MNDSSAALFEDLAGHLYLVFTIGLMLFLPIGQYLRWLGSVREKHRAPSLSLLLCLCGLTAIIS
jgi:hypothetical protein